MYEHRELKARVDQALDEFVREETASFAAVHADLLPVAEQLRVSVADGKRLRAAFCYWAWRAAGQPDSDAVIRAAAAMELLHAAATVHDDIIDDSATRRGAPTAHVALRAAIERACNARDADAEVAVAAVPAGARLQVHAAGLAILVGDLLMAWAGQMFAGCGLPGAYVARARPLWSVLARELVAGECLEILHTGEHALPAATVERSLEIVWLKTAKYSVERPLHIGGTLAGAPGYLLSIFTAYGVPLGEAFQLRDDLLGMFGDPAHTGKSNVDDLAGGKPTALLAATLVAAQPSQARQLRKLMGRTDLDDEELGVIRDLMQRTGARQRVEDMIAQRAATARQVIGQAHLPSRAAAALTHLVQIALTRQA